MYPKTIPLICDFTLHCMQEKIVLNKLNPLELEYHCNKVQRYEIVEYTQNRVEIHALAWKNECILEGMRIFHFIEIVQAFLHNQLMRDRSYWIFDSTLKRGLLLQMSFKEEPYLMIYTLSSLEDNDKQEIASLNKVECRILVRVLNNQITNSAIVDEIYTGSTEYCYAKRSFRLQEHYK